jgi:hypothetical protein
MLITDQVAAAPCTDLFQARRATFAGGLGNVAFTRRHSC